MWPPGGMQPRSMPAKRGSSDTVSKRAASACTGPLSVSCRRRRERTLRRAPRTGNSRVNRPRPGMTEWTPEPSHRRPSTTRHPCRRQTRTRTVFRKAHPDGRPSPGPLPPTPPDHNRFDSQEDSQLSIIRDSIVPLLLPLSPVNHAPTPISSSS